MTFDDNPTTITPARRREPEEPETHRLLRGNWQAKGLPAKEWVDTSYIPLPDEDPDEDVQDALADLRDFVLSERITRKGEDAFGINTQDLPSPLTRDEIIEAQADDYFCQSIYTNQLGHKGTLFFEAEDGVLCRRDPRESDVVQIVLPKTLKHRVLRLAHYHPLAGHPGHSRLCGRLRRTYYWPQMSADAMVTVRECTHCAKNRIRLMKKTNPLKLFPAAKPLEQVAIDILGPLPKSISGAQFVLVMTDRFSKLTQAVPLTKIKAQDVAAAFLNEWVFKYGPPKHLVSDNGSQFVSLFFQRVCQLLRINNKYTTTYHPQTNGQAERFNRTLTAMLRCYICLLYTSPSPRDA